MINSFRNITSVQATRSGESSLKESFPMDAWKIFLRSVTIVLSSIGIILSLLAIIIRTLLASYAEASTSQTILSKPLPPAAGILRGRIAPRFQRLFSVPVLASYPHSDISENTMRHSIVDRAVPHIHAPAPVTESPTHRFKRIKVSTEIHKIQTGPLVLISPSINASRIMTSPASNEHTTRLRGTSSVGSFLKFSTRDSLCPLKNTSHSSDPPLRTQPYAAPYFFPAPGTPEAIDYVRKTREELLRPRQTLRRFSQED